MSDGVAVERILRSDEVLASEGSVLADVLKVRFYPFVAAAVVAVRMWDIDGREYLDLTGSAGVAHTGYGHPRVFEAIAASLRGHPTGMLCCHAHEGAATLAERLCELELTSPQAIDSAEIDEALAIFERAITDVEGGAFDDAELLAPFAGW